MKIKLAAVTRRSIDLDLSLRVVHRHSTHYVSCQMQILEINIKEILSLKGRTAESNNNIM